MLQKRFIVLSLLIPLLNGGCGNNPRHNIQGIWKSECFHDERGRTFKEDLYFAGDNTFEKRIHIRYRGKGFSSHSGEYQIKNDRLEFTYKKSALLNSSEKLVNVRSLNWLNEDSLVVSGGGIKCNYYRQKSL